MNIITKTTKKTLIVNKSRFVGYLFYTNNKKQLDDYLRKLRIDHPKASHICYASVIDNHHYASDDHEPQNSAKGPMLQALIHFNMTNTTMVIVRYFGGSKLGLGKLTRAYNTLAYELLHGATIDTPQVIYQYNISITSKPILLHHICDYLGNLAIQFKIVKLDDVTNITFESTPLDEITHEYFWNSLIYPHLLKKEVKQKT